MRVVFLIILIGGLAACGRPSEVRSLSASALPVAVELKSAAQALQIRSAQQRAALESRAGELAAQVARARTYTAGVERDWRFSNDKELLRKLALLREEDAALIEDPLSPVATPMSGTVAPLDFEIDGLSTVVGNLDTLGKRRPRSASELFGFFGSMSDELRALNEEQSNTAP